MSQDVGPHARGAAKKKVFVSFDFDRDKMFLNFVMSQSRLADSPFEVIHWSLKEEAPTTTWEDKTRAAIKGSDIVKEVKSAGEESVKVVQVYGFKDSNFTAVPDAGKVYPWNWENVKALIT